MKNKGLRPLQRISYAEKIANDGEWGKNNTDYYISISNFAESDITQRDISSLYTIYNNEFPENWFYYVTNPLSTTNENYKNFPAKIRSYSIIRPNVDLFLGEYKRRPFNYQVINGSDDSYSLFSELLNQKTTDILKQYFINHVNEAGIDTGEESEELADPEEILQSYIQTYKDAKAVKGQKLLKIIENNLHIKELLRLMFKDWIIAGENYSYKGLRFDSVDYDRVSPLECDYDKSSSVKHIEDGEWFIRRRLLTVSDIIDRHYDKLKESDYRSLESIESISGRAATPAGIYNSLTKSSNKEDLRNKIEEIHLVWKAKKKIGYLTYPDPITGEERKTIVSEEYKVDKEAGESIEWEWINEVWESYKINRDIYIPAEPIENQRNKANNHSYCKLPYNGRRFSDTHATNLSIVELGIPYQINHIILKYRLELTIAKSKGKIALIDKNAIPNDEHWDEEKFIYYSEALGWGFLDRTQPGVDRSWNQYTTLDLTLLDQMKEYVFLIENNKQEWDELLGITRQRKGAMNSSDAVTNNQQSIIQSSTISDIIFSDFEEFILSEYRGLLDLAKLTNKEGIKKVYNTDKLTTELLELAPEELMDSELDIFVTDSTEEIAKLQMLKDSAHAFAQNGATPSTIAEVIGASNFAETKNLLLKIERMEMENAAKSAENEQAGKEELLRIQQEFEAMKNNLAIDQINVKADRDVEKMEREYDRKENIEYIKGDVAIHTWQGTPDTNNNGIADINEIEKRAIEREKVFSSERMKSMEMVQKDKEINLKAKTEKYKADKALEVAKENKNKFDKK